MPTVHDSVIINPMQMLFLCNTVATSDILYTDRPKRVQNERENAKLNLIRIHKPQTCDYEC